MRGKEETALLLDELNNELNIEFLTLMRFVFEGSSVQGVQFGALRRIYNEELAITLSHSQYLADWIVRLGGRPAAKLPRMPHSHELPDLVAMVERDLSEEEDGAARYKLLAERAERAESFELKEWLEAKADQKLQRAQRLRALIDQFGP
jgi:bacterioferritin